MSTDLQMQREPTGSSDRRIGMSDYLAQDRRVALALGQELPDRTTGTALFADVSGFTPLTEALCNSLGPRRGAEELSKRLNAVYHALISQVELHGGSVIDLAGDAITCWFDDAKGQERGPWRAAACALALQQVMQAFQTLPLPNGTHMVLAFKVTITTGPARRLVVGDRHIQLLDTLAGTTLTRIATGDQLAQPGEVLADEATIAALGAAAGVAEWRTDTATPARFAVLQTLMATITPSAWPEVALAAEQVREWILSPVYEREISGQGAFLTELRSVVAIFVGFTGIDYESAAGGAQLDDWIQQAQRVLARHGGTLLQLIIGDKGSYLYAVFGAPIAHEDDARRAVRAALELRDAARGMARLAPVQIGLSQGTMRAGSCGGSSRRTYGVTGDEVNLAARLMQAAAPGEILASGRVQRATAEDFVYEDRPPLQVKGKAEPVPIYRPVREPSRTAAIHNLPTQIVGRETELARLKAALDALQRDVSSTLIIEGEAGIGKSRLALELQEQATRRSVGCLLGWADAVEKTTPYHAWRPVFAHVLGWDTLPEEPEARRAEALARLNTILPPDRDDPFSDLNPEHETELAPLLNAVLPLDLPDNEITLLLQGEGRANKTNNFLSRILQRYAGGNPLVLLLEDAQWMDSASWALARLVSLDVQPLLLALVTRPLSDPLPKEYRQFLDSPNLIHLELESLSLDDALRLVCARLGVAHLPEDVAALIRERAEGHPFFSEELAYALRDAGLILVQNDVCQVAPDVNLKTVTFPDTVQGVIASRIDLLTPQQQLTLKVASVIGRVFAMRVLRDVYPIEADEARLPEYVDHLARLDITPLDTPPPDLSYIFKHVITQEVSYNLMLFAQRQMLHRAVAEWYEGTYADDLAPYYPLLAHHWQAAEKAGKAVDYLVKAGEQAMKNGAYREAIGSFAQALRMEDRLDVRPPALQRAQWTYQLGEACFNIGRLVESREHLLQAAALLGFPLPASNSTLALDLLKQLVRQAWHRLDPRRKPVEAAADRAIELLVASRAYEGLAEIAYMNGEKIPAIYNGFRYLNLAEQAGALARAQQARGYSSMAMGFGVMGLHRLAELYVRLATAAARQLDNLDATAWICLALGVYHCDRGQLSQAQARINQGRHLAERAGHVRRWEEIVAYSSACHYFQGQLDAAMLAAVDVTRVAARQGDKQAEGWGFSWQAKAAMRKGQLAQALDLARQAEDIFSSLQLETELLSTSGVLLRIQLRCGEEEAARHVAERVFASLKQITPTWQILIDSFTGLAEYCLTQWEERPTDGRRRLAQDVGKRFARFARIFDIAKPSAWVHLGWYYQLARQPRRAHHWIKKGIAAAQQCGMPYEEAEGYYHLGRFSSTSDAASLAARHKYLEQAALIFEHIGAAWDVEQVREAQERALSCSC